MSNKSQDKDEKKQGGGVALPAQLYVSEAARSAEKTKQERLSPDPNEAEWLKLIRAGLGIEEKKGEACDNS